MIILTQSILARLHLLLIYHKLVFLMMIYTVDAQSTTIK